jgi:plastocyanin
MTSNRYEPAVISVRPGDTVRFSNARGGPHNVEFFADSISQDAQRLLAAAMPGDKIGPLSSPLLILDDSAYEVTVPALAPGRYAFVCRPHFAAGMRGAMVVADSAS